MLAALIEGKVVAAVSAALQSADPALTFSIFGSWNPAAAFCVKNEEDDGSVVTVGVALSTPAVPTFTAPQFTVAGAITLSVRFELDPTGEHFLAAAEAVDALLRAWQAETYQQLFDALDGEDWSVDDISVDAATPKLDRTNKITNITFPFTLSGSLPNTPN